MFVFVFVLMLVDWQGGREGRAGGGKKTMPYVFVSFVWWITYVHV